MGEFKQCKMCVYLALLWRDGTVQLDGDTILIRACLTTRISCRQDFI